MQRDIIVIGASAGGVEALSELVAKLPADLDAAIFIVVHIGPEGPGLLPGLLDRRGLLHAVQAEQDAPIVPRNIYVAPPDHHLVLEPGRMCLVRGPVENRHRPAVDALFRTAAAAYGPRVIGVVLSGYLDDGTAGLIAIKHAGGTAIVQDPDDALVPGMPESAIANVDVDYVRPLEEIPELLVSLVNNTIELKPMAKEKTKVKKQADPGAIVDPKGLPSAYTCPQCSGTLWEVNDGALLRFACRVGHAFSADSMLQDQADSMERALWAALRSLEERSDLLQRLAARAERQGHPLALRRFREQARATRSNAEVLRNLLTNGRGGQARERRDDKAEQAEHAESA